MNEEQIRQIVRDEMSKKKQQITYPIDTVSQNILQQNLPVFFKATSGSPTTNGTISVKINGQTYYLMTSSSA